MDGVDSFGNPPRPRFRGMISECASGCRCCDQDDHAPDAARDAGMLDEIIAGVRKGADAERVVAWVATLAPAGARGAHSRRAP